MNCRVIACDGAMDGQMVVCAPHWSLLSPDLRLEVVAAHDRLAAENKAGNVHRASRMLWKSMVAKVEAELRVARGVLFGQDRSSPRGIDWVRRARAMVVAQQAAQVAADKAAEEATDG